MDRIIVATDFSPRSDRALRRASLVARKVGAALTLVHVADADRADRLIDAERDAAAAVLEQSVQTLRDEDGIDADWLIEVDDVHSGVLAAADAISAGLIVIGPHRSRLRDIFVGTTAERLVRRTTRPLLVAAEMPAANHRKALLALDFDEASRAAAREAMAMGLFDHIDVVVMHAFDAVAEGMMKRSMTPLDEVETYVDGEAEAAAGKLRALIADLDLPPTCETVVSIKGSPARTILESARKVDADLVVIGTNQRHGFERALVGSVTEDVIRDARGDVLIIPVSEPG